MTPQELKNSILQLAIQGKLVEQRPEEGTGKDQLIKNGKRAFSNTDAFDVPATWCWALLPDISDILYGFPFNSEKFNMDGVGMPIIRIRDIISGRSKTFSDEDCDEQYRIKCGDMLVGMDGNFQVAFWKSEDAWLNQRVCRITADTTLIDQNYLFYYLPIVLAEINGSVSFSTVKHLSAKILNAMLIPLPPLAEQKRIVAKIEELLPYIDRYAEAWNRLEDFNKRFPEDLRKSILQLAIQGKLVEQRPEEGTGEELYREIQREKAALIKAGKIKKEKPLPEIKEDEVPFEIPEGWKWVSIGAVCTNIQYGTASKSDKEGKVAVLRMGNIQNGKIIYDKLVYTSDDDEIAKYPLDYNDLLFNRTNSKELVGKTAIFKEEIPAIYAGYLIRITPVLMCSDYLNYVMQTQFYWSYCQTVRSDAIGQSNINAEKLKAFVFPLPPLGEQKRIVEKVEELLAVCEGLK